MKMTILQFLTTYCKDLIENAKVTKELVDLSTFAHDAIITDVEGNKIPVVIVDNLEIPVSDFLTMERADFVREWKSVNVGEAYDNYLSALMILEGADAVYRARQAILAERDRLSQDVELVTTV